MEGLFSAKAAVVTGAASGIGRAIAEALLAQGAAVLVADIDEQAAQRTAAELRDAGGTAVARRCDVTSPEEVEAVVAAAVAELGGCDVLVNNAGITRDATIGKMSLEDFRAVLDVHLTGAWLGTKAAFVVMRDTGGAIVNISSISGKVGNFGQTNYSAAKAGIVGLTKASAKEGARHGIRVNAVMPGLIRTAMTAGMPPDVLLARVAEVPLGRIGEPEDIADAVVFLASQRASYITGVVLEVAGGRHL